ncbi:hypothetical protein BG006_005907 [Podila minutissima]|uniref:Uncharacterized protein n=1 Tax=Podila minutissima TaxID=64525 RepID=A0A9P5SUT2_9FUNG|nr:hypothetical protein BG006_005907 [Podila minutissima]
MEHSPRLQELWIVEEECTDFYFQVARFAHIIVRGHCSLKNLKLKTQVMYCQTYSLLLWASGICPPPRYGSSFSDQYSEEHDAWMAKTRPDICTATMDGRNGGDDNDDHRKTSVPQIARFNSEVTRKDVFRADGSVRIWSTWTWPTLNRVECWGDDVDAELLVACATPKSRYGGLKSLVMASTTRHVIVKILQTVLALHATTLVDLNLQGCSIIRATILRFCCARVPVCDRL